MPAHFFILAVTSTACVIISWTDVAFRSIKKIVKLFQRIHVICTATGGIRQKATRRGASDHPNVMTSAVRSSYLCPSSAATASLSTGVCCQLSIKLLNTMRATYSAELLTQESVRYPNTWSKKSEQQRAVLFHNRLHSR